MHICRVYIHILSLANICIGYINMFFMLICLFTCIFNAAYVHISENQCKCLLPCNSYEVKPDIEKYIARFNIVVNRISDVTDIKAKSLSEENL